MNCEQNHDVLEDWQLLLFFQRQGDVNEQLGWRPVAESYFRCACVSYGRVEGFHLKVGLVADVVCSICQYEIEIQPGERIEEIKFSAVKLRVPLKPQLEFDVFGAWGGLKDTVALTDAIVDNREPFALGRTELDRVTLEERHFFVRKMCLDFVLVLVT